jgi:hypothetical protein
MAISTADAPRSRRAGLKVSLELPKVLIRCNIGSLWKKLEISSALLLEVS